MIWDAAWDQQNVIKGRVYSDHIADIISRSGSGFSTASTAGVPPTPTPFPTAGIKTTPGASPTPEGSSTPGASKPPAPTTPPVQGGSSTPAASKPTTSPLVPATSPSTPVGGGGGGAGKTTCGSYEPCYFISALYYISLNNLIGISTCLYRCAKIYQEYQEQSPESVVLCSSNSCQQTNESNNSSPHEWTPTPRKIFSLCGPLLRSLEPFESRIGFMLLGFMINSFGVFNKYFASIFFSIFNHIFNKYVFGMLFQAISLNSLNTKPKQQGFKGTPI